MRFESQTHLQDDHIGRITDRSTRYGQAPAVSTSVRLAKGRCVSVTFNPHNADMFLYEPKVFFYLKSS